MKFIALYLCAAIAFVGWQIWAEAADAMHLCQQKHSFETCVLEVR